MASRNLCFTGLNSNRQNVTDVNSNQCDGKGDFRDSPSFNQSFGSNNASFRINMASRTLGQQNVCNSSSPIFMQRRMHLDVSPMSTLSPVSSLVSNLNSTNLSETKKFSSLSDSSVHGSTPQLGVTPFRRLPLSSDLSNVSDTSASASGFSSFSSSFIKHRGANLSCSLSESIKATTTGLLEDIRPLMPSSPMACSPLDKENCLHGTPKDKLMTASRRRRRTPFKDIQNLGSVNRSLQFNSPCKKVLTPSKNRSRLVETLPETSPPDDPDFNNQDSGFSESVTKNEDVRLRDDVSVAPRKLILDTPTKKFSALKPTVDVTLLPSSIKAADSNKIQNDSENIPPASSSAADTSDSLMVSEETRDSPDSLASTSAQQELLSIQRQSSSLAAKPSLPSFFTESACFPPSQEYDEDLCMHELYSLEEADETVPRRPSSSPQMDIGALLSGPVNTSVLSSCSGSEHNKSNVDSEAQDSDAVDGSIKLFKSTSKNLFSTLSNDKNQCVPLERQDTEILIPKLIVETAENVTESPLATRPSMAFTPSPQPQLPRGRVRSRIGSVLCTDVEVSPFNPNVRLPMRRALSLCDVSPPVSATESRKGSSPNYAFKRPLPPSDVSPFIETKRHKTYAVGSTPTLPAPQFKPLPMLKFDASPSNTVSNSTVCPMEESQSPPLSMTSRCMSDASPELPFSKAGGLPRSESSMGLVTRQYSVPIATKIQLGEEENKDALSRAHSESHLAIMKALSKSQHHEDELTGDFGRSLSLPIVSCGRHPDIKAISPDTMAMLLQGEFSETVQSFQVFDCRFPYEYEGGHIKGAESWHNPQFVVDHIGKAEKASAPADIDPSKRHILIFHCEFSAERGPRAQRLLRERDRTVNKDRYPSLHFPETYLLEGGYKAFFEQYPELCVPETYTKMVDGNFAEDLKLCRARSKSWALENKQAKGGRSGHWSKRFNRH